MLINLLDTIVANTLKEFSIAYLEKDMTYGDHEEPKMLKKKLN